ncbi:MinD/ParA family protein [Aetokthonos hydrillicola Thurmond2011]|uniref:MinD/ParA family protein n=1 Tax=Aetokthonos hydrillicola Thurmond2011 TaxID=2712845 RepID=A0AAP5I5E4_9CYAN|nr:MinD/ParA family protein [Aetokthonos hydrillicola]MBO3464179.1 MinD/ParA family protein [Aetokthonos hydrillicola CCALA 1050]MBW4590645.1 MinD/ParA family protein [Aetokthonos hydrillicola CCALA 1050]MDR9895015.1 MinD/ParA family protein [Aetokthonos hydrillicola Thurmond2011]
MPKIISIHSYRGGTGKSNSTANIATAIACKGNRVGIVDTDLQSPGIHILFGLEDGRVKHTLNDFLWGRCAITDAAYDVKSVLKDQTNNRSSIYLVPSSVKLNDISRVIRERFDVELLLKGFKDLIKNLKLDYLFVDTHPGLNQETLISLTTSDIVLLVLRPDQQDFQGTAVTVDVARRLRVPKLLLLINKVLKDYDFNDLQNQIEQVYQTPVAGMIPESEDLLRLASKGIFYLQDFKHPISQAIEKVAKQIIV